ncbi:MAG TPA: UTP--glucose-1-phosphate uridylyltransferase [Tepidisphaeraceae bacterium]|jgi:UTP--glucose-1-phosphate uridylyltransferase
MTKPLRKAVIPAAGFGTRMLPAAKSVPKEMLPILDRPTIQYVIDEASAAGASDIVLVTSKEKTALESHFARHPLLEQRLKESGRDALLADLNSLIDRIRIHPVYQTEQLGLGHAVLQAKDAVGDEPFICLLGDTIFSAADQFLPAMQLRQAYERFGTSVIGLEEVSPEKVERYGIVGGDVIEPGLLKLNTLVEKPSRDKAPSRFAIAARYILTPAVFDCLEKTSPGKGGEIQLTDALRGMLQRGEAIHGVVLKSKRHDIGNPVDWLKTNLIFAAHDPKLWEQLRPTLDELMNRGANEKTY